MPLGAHIEKRGPLLLGVGRLVLGCLFGYLRDKVLDFLGELPVSDEIAPVEGLPGNGVASLPAISAAVIEEPRNGALIVVVTAG